MFIRLFTPLFFLRKQGYSIQAPICEWCGKPANLPPTIVSTETHSMEACFCSPQCGFDYRIALKEAEKNQNKLNLALGLSILSAFLLPGTPLLSNLGAHLFPETLSKYVSFFIQNIFGYIFFLGMYLWFAVGFLVIWFPTPQMNFFGERTRILGVKSNLKNSRTIGMIVLVPMVILITLMFIHFLYSRLF